MITRIVMDVEMNTQGKDYIAGAVYDSRIPADCPAAADGIQHSIPQHRLDFFIARRWAHEQTWDEWAANKPAFSSPPKMLAALELAWQLLMQSGMSVGNLPGNSFDLIQAVIAEAKGAE